MNNEARPDPLVSKNYGELANGLITKGWHRSSHKRYKEQFIKNDQAVAIVYKVGSSTWYIKTIEYNPVNEALEWFYSLEPHEQQAQIEIRYQEFCSNI